ncbi:hypothetical protein [Microbacterium saperdae]|uniref:LPXTG-motif cell wall-anchored protein n=1 Tax=Microbacterium saperdae TaxID=69368 RepID=A0A543BJQ2_9MICO|nr:hypothetical protein [Microbacterium saperdae]TQL85036.1 hypothetical protein FB560_0631 [Microbacterium saperdae]GGM57503.1 hypothetical protein GCM10010489_31370 [Microbacterium saperdae]
MIRGRSLAVLSALVVGSALFLPTAAWAAPTTQVIQGDVLRLVSVADWDAASRLLPGEPVQWDVAISADAPDPGSVRIAVSARGDAPVVIDAALCMREWEVGGCPGGATALRTAWSIPRDGAEIALAEIADTEVAHLRLAITLDTDDEGGSTDIRVHAQGAGESAVVGPDGGLATTGLSPIVPLACGAGALLVATGAVLILDHRRRAARDKEDAR